MEACLLKKVRWVLGHCAELIGIVVLTSSFAPAQSRIDLQWW
jgi:hypothetical protein